MNLVKLIYRNGFWKWNILYRYFLTIKTSRRRKKYNFLYVTYTKGSQVVLSEVLKFCESNLGTLWTRLI